VAVTRVVSVAAEGLVTKTLSPRTPQSVESLQDQASGGFSREVDSAHEQT
jgi:hypothetical protein